MPSEATDAYPYTSPLGTRYASAAMRKNFSDRTKFTTWRRLWIALAEGERELGLVIDGEPIREEQIEELRATADHLDLELAARYEKELRHDVMAHVHAWGESCPKARPIIHLGATSCYVGDNTDIIVMREGLRLLRGQLVGAIRALSSFAREWKGLPTLGFTHFQPAQATTVGKRACLWIQDLLHDLEDLVALEENHLRFRGVKGTTGTQASFLELFEGDHDKVRELDRIVTEKMGFERTFGVTGQTYPRKLDYRVLAVLSSVCQSAHKFATDLRLLANKRELEEPFGKKQIGSSAMPWKRNPMRSERICALSRFVIELVGNAAHTAANQWLERTLDDSANRRLAIAEAFLATDAVLQLMIDVGSGLLVHPPIVAKHLGEELPFLASEAVLMEAVKRGGDRQDLHERIRVHSHAAAAEIKAGRRGDMRERLSADPAFADVAGDLDALLDGERYVGRAPEQVEEFLGAEVDPILARFADEAVADAEIRV